MAPTELAKQPGLHIHRQAVSSSRDLKTLVDAGKFCDDLYFRLNVLPIQLPPLRARLSDLGPLCEVIREQISSRAEMPLRELTPATLSSHPGADGISTML